jgi:hypothetical protein
MYCNLISVNTYISSTEVTAFSLQCNRILMLSFIHFISSLCSCVGVVVGEKYYEYGLAYKTLTSSLKSAIWITGYKQRRT